MITILPSPKPGSGVSTTAALLALAISHDTPTHLVDLCGDQLALFGLVPRPGATIEVDKHLTIRDLTHTSVHDQATTIDRLAELGEHVIIDAGIPDHSIHDRLPAGTVRRWVLRPCYLALRRVADHSVRPDEVIMLSEPGRSLTAHDIAAITSAPVTTRLDSDPHIARAADSGLRCTQPPASVLTSLADLARPQGRPTMNLAAVTGPVATTMRLQGARTHACEEPPGEAGRTTSNRRSWALRLRLRVGQGSADQARPAPLS